jgi:hypothetical protein
MAFEDIQAEIGLLLARMQNEPGDELYRWSDKSSTRIQELQNLSHWLGVAELILERLAALACADC